MSNTRQVKLSDGSEFEFLSDKYIDLGLLKKIAELSDSELYSLVTDAGVKYEGKPSKTDLIMSLDEIDTAVLKDLYKKYTAK
ncbi:MAG: hypothetical protein WCK87_03665 [Candidatus Saccharibacteria bacterium]